MKRFNFVIVIVIILMIMTLTACSPKVALSADDFDSIMTAAGYGAMDGEFLLTDDSRNTGLLSYFIADCLSFHVEYFAFDSEMTARQNFNSFRNSFEDGRGRTSSTSEVNVSNYNKFTITTDGQFSVVTRVENTLVVVSASSEYKAEVNAVLDLLGY